MRLRQPTLWRRVEASFHYQGRLDAVDVFGVLVGPLSPGMASGGPLCLSFQIRLGRSDAAPCRRATCDRPCRFQQWVFRLDGGTGALKRCAGVHGPSRRTVANPPALPPRNAIIRLSRAGGTLRSPPPAGARAAQPGFVRHAGSADQPPRLLTRRAGTAESPPDGSRAAYGPVDLALDQPADKAGIRKRDLIRPLLPKKADRLSRRQCKQFYIHTNRDEIDIYSLICNHYRGEDPWGE